ncbi:MAG: hypothetical protein JF604_11570, partial [Bradyrhizobium sp.]|nr:hypothetical protein [Bradyrhizobium sp.]
MRGIDVVRDEGFSDAAGQYEGELAALHLLVLRNQVHQAVGRDIEAWHIADVCRQAGRRKVVRDAARIVAG